MKDGEQDSLAINIKDRTMLCFVSIEDLNDNDMVEEKEVICV